MRWLEKLYGATEGDPHDGRASSGRSGQRRGPEVSTRAVQNPPSRRPLWEQSRLQTRLNEEHSVRYTRPPNSKAAE